MLVVFSPTPPSPGQGKKKAVDRFVCQFMWPWLGAFRKGKWVTAILSFQHIR